MIGYIILAHHQPAYLADLIKTLNSPNAKFFVHIDGSADIKEFENLKLSNTIFIENRVPVFWVGFNTIKATLNLIKHALKDEKLEKICFLSGSCFPIKPINQIEQVILSQPFDFINLEYKSPVTEDHKFYKRFADYHLLDNKILTLRNKKPNAITARKYLKSFLDELPKKELPKEYKIYVGSQWWCLSRSTLLSMLSIIDKQYLDFFKYAYCSDEAFFQTLWMRLKEEGKVDLNNLKPNLHYINWKEKGRIGSFPKTLDERDFAVLKNSDKLFARKFDERVSNQLKQRLLNNIINEGPQVKLKKIKKQGSKKEHKQALFLMSHMRGMTSVISHILGSNPEIKGYSEKHKSYLKPADLNLEKLVEGEYYAFDKLLHNGLEIAPRLINQNKVKLLLSIRKPEATIQSMLRMGNQPNSNLPWLKEEDKVVNYYVNRLKFLGDFYSKYQSKIFFFEAEELENEPEQLLSSISNYLALETPLKEEYQKFEHTGKPGHGDPSMFIHSGKILKERPSEQILLNSNLLEKAYTVYQNLLAEIKQV